MLGVMLRGSQFITGTLTRTKYLKELPMSDRRQQASKHLTLALSRNWNQALTTLGGMKNKRLDISSSGNAGLMVGAD